MARARTDLVLRQRPSTPGSAAAANAVRATFQQPEEAGASCPTCTGEIVPMGTPAPHAGVRAALTEAVDTPVCELEDTAPLPQPATFAAINNPIKTKDERVKFFMAAFTVD